MPPKKVQKKNGPKIIVSDVPDADLAKASEVKYHIDDNVHILDKDTEVFVEQYFNAVGFAYHQIQSYNNFIEELAPKIVEQDPKIEITHKNKIDKTIVEFSNLTFLPPVFTEINSEKISITPTVCQHRDITYTSSVHIDIKITKPNGDIAVHPKYFIGKVPVMVKSNLCNIRNMSDEELYKIGECPKNIGGYFIVEGSKKVVISQERTSFNKPYTFKNRKNPPKFSYYTEVRSSAANGTHTTTTQAGVLKDKLYDKIFCILPYILDKNYIPVGVVFKAMGIIEEKDFVKFISDDKDYIAKLYPTLEHSFPIRTQEEALYFIGKRGKKFENSVDPDVASDEINDRDSMADSDTDMSMPTEGFESSSESRKNKTREEAIAYANHLIKVELFPHLGKSYIKKCYYLGDIIRNLLKILVEKDNFKGPEKWEEREKRLLEDRDHYGNKRLDAVGDLMNNLFYKSWKKLRGDCQLGCEKALSKSSRDINPLSNIKNTTITDKMTKCLSSGNWSGTRVLNKKKNGISQTYEQYNYGGAISNLRKTNIAIGQEGKIVEPRRLHESSWGFKCPKDTAEGKTCGLVTSLALSTIVSVGCDPTDIIKLIKDMVTPFPPDSSLENIAEEKPYRYLNDVKVMVNGNWIGFLPVQTSVVHKSSVTQQHKSTSYHPKNLDKKCYEFYCYIKSLKRSLSISAETGIIFDVASKQLKILTDSGRMMRPLFIVENGELLAKKHHLEKLVKGEWNWYDLLRNGLVEYIDPEEQNQPHILIANHPSEIFMHPGEKPYTHCELHPQLIFSIGATTIPYLNHNPSPRCTYQCAMSKQSMGVPFLNYREVMNGQFHVLMYPQKPLADTMGMRLYGYDDMPSGQNLIACICPFNGFNQEDSIILNQSAVDRGLMRSTYYVCYCVENKKGFGISFEIPNMAECEAIKGTRTDHLDIDGIPKVGERIYRGDIIVGKTLLNKKDDNKRGKTKIDISMIFDDGECGIIESVQKNANGKGYECVKIKIGVVRIPELGDKFSSRFSQKGTCGMMYRTEDLPFTKDGVVPDILINSLAFPSRMTIGQIIETIVGKKCVSQKKKILDPKTGKNLLDPDPKDVEYIASKLMEKDLEKIKSRSKNEKEYKSLSAKIKGSMPHYLEKARSKLIEKLEMKYRSDEKENRKNYTSDHTKGDATTFVGTTEWEKATIDPNYNPDGIWMKSCADNTYIREAMKTLHDMGYEYTCEERMINGMTGEMMEASIFIGPTYYQRLKHMAQDKIHCLSMDHQVLTQSGWKSFFQITTDDKIATLKDGKVVYDNPIKLLYYPDFSGKMCHVHTSQVDLKVTSNHRMWVSSSDSDFSLVNAEDLIGKNVKYQKNGVWDREDYQFILPKIDTTPEKVVNMDSWLKIFGVFIVGGRVGRFISFKCKLDARWALISAVQDMGRGCMEEYCNFLLVNPQIASYFRNLDGKMPDWVWNLSSRQSKILLEYMYMCDSRKVNCLCWSESGSLYDSNPEKDLYVFSEELADDTMRLALQCGWSANKIKVDDRWKIDVVKESAVESCDMVLIEDSREPVFCLQVPSEVFYVRRNGKGVWTGNSRARGPNQTLTRQPREGRSQEGGLRFGEMERDNMIAQGAAYFLKDRLFENSDMYKVPVCGICGLIAIQDKNTGEKYCKSCKSSNVEIVKIPYASKLMFQEFSAMNMIPRILTVPKIKS